MRLIDHFDKGVERYPDRAFLIDSAITRTFLQVQASSHRIANALTRAGLAPGMKAAVYSGNAARAFECLLGIVRAGLVWVPVNARNTVADSAYTMQSCDVDMLFYQKAFTENVHALAQQCPKIRYLVCIDDTDDKVPSLDAFTAGCGDISPDIPQSDDDPVTLYNSGGTTGLPKAILMTHRSWEAMAASSQILVKTENPVHLVAAPMTHAAGGSALAYSVLGMTNVMLSGFEPKMVMEAIQRHRVTHLFLPPTAIYRLLAHPDVRNYDYSSLRYFTYASAPMSVEKLKEAVAVFGPVMTNSFGQSETGILGTFLAPDEVARAVKDGNDRVLASVGRAGPLFRVEIMDDDGHLIPPGAPGEIVMRSSQLFSLYYKNPEETARAKAFGWHHTGDIGVKDEQGYIYVVDRKKDMIISGGFNVYPADVERIVINHPAVQDCAVVGAPHEDWGELVTAVVELKPGATLTEKEVIAWCRERLSGVQSPKAVQFVKELPRSPVGKVLRRKVREPFWADREKKI